MISLSNCSTSSDEIECSVSVRQKQFSGICLVSIMVACVCILLFGQPLNSNTSSALGMELSAKVNNRRYEDATSTYTTDNDKHLQVPTPTQLHEMESHYSKFKNKKRQRTNQRLHDRDIDQNEEDTNRLVNNTKAGDSTHEHTELESIVKKLNQNYKYEGTGFSKKNFPGLETLGGALRGKRHNGKKKPNI